MEYCQLHSTPDPLPRTIPTLKSPKHTRHSAKRTIKRQSYPTYTSFFLDQSKQDLQALISFLQRSVAEIQEEEITHFANILKDQNIFPEFFQDLKVLTFLIDKLKIKTLSENESLYTLQKQDQNLYKVLKGEVLVKKANERAGRGRGKGEFVEQPEDYKIYNNIQAYARRQCILIVVNFNHYQQAVKRSTYNKKILQMLSATSLFSNLRRKQLAYLLENSQEVVKSHKETLFREGADTTHNCFLVIQGDLIILKQSHEKPQVVCTVSQGNFVGEQTFFDEVRRTYTASVNSNNAKILVICASTVQKMIENFKINKEKIFSAGYRSYLQVRGNHYSQQIQGSLQIKDSFHQAQRPVKMSPSKQKHILHILRDIQNDSSRLDIKEKLIEKRYKLSAQGRKEASIITVDNPLFVRQDFPGLRKFVKRCNIFESRAREGCKLPSLV